MDTLRRTGALARAGEELTTEEWKRALDVLHALGVTVSRCVSVLESGNTNPEADEGKPAATARLCPIQETPAQVVASLTDTLEVVPQTVEMIIDPDFIEVDERRELVSKLKRARAELSTNLADLIDGLEGATP